MKVYVANDKDIQRCIVKGSKKSFLDGNQLIGNCLKVYIMLGRGNNINKIM